LTRVIPELDSHILELFPEPFNEDRERQASITVPFLLLSCGRTLWGGEEYGNHRVFLWE
jgi:hypothetical protein